MPLAAPTLADGALLHSMRSVAARLGVLAALLRILPVPLPFPRSLSRVVPSAARALSPSAAAGLSTLPTPSPLLLAASAQACPLRLSLGTPPVATCPPLRAPMAGTLPRLPAVPPLPDHAPGVLLPPQLRQRDAWRRTLGCRGADRPPPSRREGGFGVVRLGGAGVGVAGAGVGAVLGALPALRCGCGGPRSGIGARAGPLPRAWGVPGAAAWPAGGCRGSLGPQFQLVLHPPRPPLRLRRLPARHPGPAPGPPPALPAYQGAAVGAAARPAGAAVSAPCAPGAPSGGGAAGLAAWAAGAVSSASARRRSSCSARVSAAHPGETRERERDGRWWRSSSWGEPSESNITVILVGMRGGRRALPVTFWCIRVVPWAVLCSAPQGG